MSSLSEILSSGVRAQIFRLLFDGTRRELHVREIERQSGYSIGTVRQELTKLLKLDLVKKRKDSNRVYFAANDNHPLYTDICSIVTKTIGLVDILRNKLQDDSISVAFLFGSIAGSSERATSDVDLMVIGDLGLRRVSELLSGIEDAIGREINPIVMTENEFTQKVKARNHFLTRVLEEPKLFIIGSDNDIKAMG